VVWRHLKAEDLWRFRIDAKKIQKAPAQELAKKRKNRGRKATDEAAT